MIAEVQGVLKKEKAQSQAPAKRMTTIQKIAKIQEVLDQEIRPSLQNDGGDVELVDLDGDRVVLAMRGMCTSCPSASSLGES